MPFPFIIVLKSIFECSDTLSSYNSSYDHEEHCVIKLFIDFGTFGSTSGFSKRMCDLHFALAKRRIRMIRHAIVSVLVVLATALLFACGSGKNGLTTPGQALGKAMFANSLSQAGQCSDGTVIAANMHYTVGLLSDGTVTAAGYNDKNQFDITGWTDVRNVRSVAAGGYHIVALLSDGTVTAAGSNDQKQLEVTSWRGVKAIAAGWKHTVGLLSDGTVTAVGYGDFHQKEVTSWRDIKAIAAGWYHTVGLKSDGTVVVAGLIYGQVDFSSWKGIKAIAAGWFHTVGLKSDGTATAGGANYGQLDVSSWNGIKAIAASEFSTIGIKSDGTVTAVRDKKYGQLDVSSWGDIKATAAGVYHMVGVKSDGTVTAVTAVTSAGYNNYNQLAAASWTGIMPVCEATEDSTPPTTSADPTGTAGNDGWYMSDVQVTLTAEDNTGGSGVKEIHYSIDGAENVTSGNTVSFSIRGDGTHSITFYAKDNAGNAEAPRKMSIPIDKTPPTITASVSPGPNANGWNNTDVTVSFICSDSVSNIATCPAAVSVTTEGAGQVIMDTAVDKAGNSATAKVTLNIDKTPPVVSLLADPSTLWPPNHKLVNVLIGGSVTDGVSGIASTVITVNDEYGTSTMSVPGLGSVIQLESWRKGSDRDGRVYTITGVVTDKAGNQSTGTTTVLVPHDARDDDSKEKDKDRDHGKDHHKKEHHDKHHGKDRDHDDRGHGR